jgi:hypothetical protein
MQSLGTIQSLLSKTGTEESFGQFGMGLLPGNLGSAAELVAQTSQSIVPVAHVEGTASTSRPLKANLHRNIAVGAQMKSA